MLKHNDCFKINGKQRIKMTEGGEYIDLKIMTGK